MFFLKEMERTILLHPSFFGPRIPEYLSHQLLKDVEASHQGDYYVVVVLDGYDFSEGKVLPGSGFAEYTVHYRAIVWKPFREEVVDGVVVQVVESGFFVDIGPLSAFVSRGMIPSYIKYDSLATPPCWTDNSDQTIEKGTQIRVKIKGLRNELDNMYAVATINEDFLGPLPAEPNPLNDEPVLKNVWDKKTRIKEWLKGKRNSLNTDDLDIHNYEDTPREVAFSSLRDRTRD